MASFIKGGRWQDSPQATFQIMSSKIEVRHPTFSSSHISNHGSQKESLETQHSHPATFQIMVLKEKV
jgi:hypothetical protein